MMQARVSSGSLRATLQPLEENSMEPPSSMADRLSGAALACCKGEGDVELVSQFVDILKTPFKNPNGGREWQLECEALLQQAGSLLDPSVPSGKELMDHVGGELPNIAVQYIGVSKDCQERSTHLIQSLATAFEPAREMFTAFFEVINIYSKPQTLHLCLPFLRGLCMVFPRISRRTAGFFKEAVPGLIEVGRSAGRTELDKLLGDPEEIKSDSLHSDRLFLSRDYMEVNIRHKVIDELIHLAKVVKDICDGGQEMQRLRDILGIFTLQLLSVAYGAVLESNTTQSDGFLELIDLLSFSNLSLSILVSVTEIDKLLDDVFDEEEFKAQANRLEAKRGAALAVYWGIQRADFDDCANKFAMLKQSFQTPGLQMVLNVISLASTLLVHVSCSQEISLKHKGLTLMTIILEVYRTSPNINDACLLDDMFDLSIQIWPALQRLQDVIIYVPSPMLRRQAYGILIEIITQVLPTQARFATLQFFISNSGHPSLVSIVSYCLLPLLHAVPEICSSDLAHKSVVVECGRERKSQVSLLLTCVKDEVRRAWPLTEGGQELGQDDGTTIGSSLSPFASHEVLEFIQIVLRTKDGEVTELPTNMDAVLGGLNLYRFLLIRESSGQTNHTQVLSGEELTKGRTYWLLPLLDQVLRVQSLLEAEESYTVLGIDSGMDSLKSVLYRCLEIVEVQLAKSPK